VRLNLVDGWRGRDFVGCLVQTKGWQRIASMKIAACIPSSGRLAQLAMSSMTLSVIRLIVFYDPDAP
jgi:hypothetical protein